MPKRKIAPYWRDVMRDVGCTPLEDDDEIDFSSMGTFSHDNYPIAQIPTPEEIRAGSIGLPPFTFPPCYSAEPVPSTSGFRFDKVVPFGTKPPVPISTESTALEVFKFEAEMTELPPYRCTRSQTRRLGNTSDTDNLILRLQRLHLNKKSAFRSRIPRLKKVEPQSEVMQKMKMNKGTKPKRAKKEN